MRVLVLSVDRDNDFGEKAGVVGPIVGREANVDAAVKLALADPEDSDANSVFGAVQAFDELVREGEDAAIATITGDRRVGSVSDRKLARALDRVLDETKPDRCVFVTDGAEDEFILPLVTSRVKVESVRRIIVKQNADLEGTYYVIKKALEDDKLQRTFLMPLALGLLVYGVFAILGQPGYGVGAISVTLGVYFFGKVIHIGDAVRRTVTDVYSGLTSGKVSFFASLLAILIAIAGAVAASVSVFEIRNASVAVLVLTAATSALWWLVASALVAAAGKVADAYIREGVMLWTYWTLPFSLVATGLILTAALSIAMNVVARKAVFLGLRELLFVVAGLTLALVGTVTNSYLRQRAERRLVQDAFARSGAREPGERSA